MIDHVDHIVLTTQHQEACIRFYTEVLGMTLEKFRTPTEERLARKACATLSVSATVYLRAGKTPVTELRWRDESGRYEYHAWSNVDFRHLTQLTQLETETTVYSWFPFVDAVDLAEEPAGWKSPLPREIQLSSTEAEYFVDSRASDLKDQESTLAALDYLHAYYQLYSAELKAAYEKREADADAREKQLREHPPIKPDATLHWWPLPSRPSAR